MCDSYTKILYIINGIRKYRIKSKRNQKKSNQTKQNKKLNNEIK